MPGRIGTSPDGDDFKKNAAAANLWLQEVGNRFSVYSGATNPTVAMIPENQWILFYNTALLETRVWTNIAGVLKKSAAFT